MTENPDSERFTIIMYHSVIGSEEGRGSRFCCPVSRFRRHMQFLRDGGYTPVGLNEIARHLQGVTSLPPKAVAVTFDDGFADNYHHAYPILREYQIPATLFVVAGLVGKDSHWMTGKGRRPLMTWAQIEELHRHGIDIGAHSLTHPRLPLLDAHQAEIEICASKREIEAKLGAAVCHFAYPFGALNEVVRGQVIKAGYATACSTDCGFNRRETDPFHLRRIEVEGTDSVGALRRKLLHGTNKSSWSVPVRYYAGRVMARLARS